MSAAGVSGGECRRIGSRREVAARARTAAYRGGARGRRGGGRGLDDRGAARRAGTPAVPVGDVDLIVGTSAGSVLAAALRCGVTLDEMIALQRGEARCPCSATRACVDLDEGPLPPPPALRAGSPRLMLTTLRAPAPIHPGVGASAWLPRGRGRHEALHATVAALDTAIASPPATRPGRRAVGRRPDLDRRRGLRHRAAGDVRPRGRPPGPAGRRRGRVLLHPGLVQPAVIDGRRYVDGGVRSSTSLRSLAQAGLDEVYVLAPMASLVPDRPARSRRAAGTPRCGG